MSLRIPSVYWPIAEMGFSRNRTWRRVFRILFCRIYRKGLRNPIINSWAKNKGFDSRRHLLANNSHAFLSALLLFLLITYFYSAHQMAAFPFLADAQRTCFIRAAVIAVIELTYNAPAIVLSRYLYLFTVRRPGLAGHNDAVQMPCASAYGGNSENHGI